jgi:hypothetical protein
MTAPITIGNERNLLRPNIFANSLAISVLFVFFLVFRFGCFSFRGFRSITILDQGKMEVWA